MLSFCFHRPIVRPISFGQLCLQEIGLIGVLLYRQLCLQEIGLIIRPISCRHNCPEDPNQPKTKRRFWRFALPTSPPNLTSIPEIPSSFFYRDKGNLLWSVVLEHCIGSFAVEMLVEEVEIKGQINVGLG